MDETGEIRAVIEVKMNKDVLVTQPRAREIVLSLQELGAAGVLTYESRRVNTVVTRNTALKRG